MTRILLAEDDPVSRALLRRALTRMGYDVLVANDGLSAWDLWRSSPDVQLVVSGWMMPGLSGVDLCRRIRDACRRHYVYILLLTGKSRPLEIAAGLDAGADDYLTKPYDVDELAARLRVGQRLLQVQNENLRHMQEISELIRMIRAFFQNAKSGSVPGRFSIELG